MEETSPVVLAKKKELQYQKRSPLIAVCDLLESEERKNYNTREPLSTSKNLSMEILMEEI